MKKKEFGVTWHFRLFQITFLIVFIFLIFLGIWGFFYEDDMPFVGFIWAGALVILYLIIKRIFYHNY